MGACGSTAGEVAARYAISEAPAASSADRKKQLEAVRELAFPLQGSILRLAAFPAAGGRSALWAAGEDGSVAAVPWQGCVPLESSSGVAVDGKAAGAGSSMSSLCRWAQTEHTSAITSLAFCGEQSSAAAAAAAGASMHFATGSRDKLIKIWSVQDSEGEACRLALKPLATLSGHTFSVTDLACSTGGSDSLSSSSSSSSSATPALLASGSRDATVRLWDLSACKELWAAHTQQNLVTCLKWLPSAPGTVLLQGGEDLRVRVWDCRMAAAAAGMSVGGAGASAASSSSPSAGGGELLREAGALQGYVYFPLAMDVSRDGQLLLTGSKGFNSIGCELRLWDLRAAAGAGHARESSAASLLASAAAAKPLKVLQGHSQDVTACLILPPLALGGSAGGAVRTGGVAGAAAGSLLRSGQQLLLSASKDESIRVWDAESGEQLGLHSEPGSGGWTSMTLLKGEREAGLPCFAVSSARGGVYCYQLQTDCSLRCLARREPTSSL